MIFFIDRVAETYTVDGVTRTIPMTYLDTDVLTITFNSNTGVGVITYDPPRLDEQIGKVKFDAYAWLLGYWKAAAPPPARTLSEVKADKKQQMRSKRNSIEQGGLIYLEKTVASDPVALGRIAIATFAAHYAIDNDDTEWEVEWPALDGTYLTLSAAQVIAMTVALADFSNSLFLWEKDKIALIDAAETEAEVEEIEW